MIFDCIDIPQSLARAVQSKLHWAKIRDPHLLDAMRHAFVLRLQGEGNEVSGRNR